MATQALLSSSSITSSVEAARQIFAGRPAQSLSRKISFVVKAASTPPVKQEQKLALIPAEIASHDSKHVTREITRLDNPGSMGKQYFLGLEEGLAGSGDPEYSGGSVFNPLGFGKDEKSMKE
ncbi:Chlorophyll a-b binding protein, chloroplastic [Heracleum sosnowskyi]|uniref:Chlorophyll a-b binding protein, chloroplastic n=1 Tax=Heracleum sosnowskyi TaxID=360622 RepID=A0AAD8M7W8_9APIA|nr:Chlorophyll a-b binding protein, chloroplastic [Heracleum sosnowskyi]